MKQQNLKKPLSVVLSGFMAISLGGWANLKLNAEGPAQIVRFATKNELGKSDNFNLRDVGENKHVYGGKGEKAQKVYFGKDAYGNLQKWFIAGAEDDGLVLFSDPAQILLPSQRFRPNLDRGTVCWRSYYCDTGRGACVYVDGTSPTEVYPNHYSSSNLRQRINALLEDNRRFSDKEKNMIVPTRIYTNDPCNHKIYYNEDKLYLAYACVSKYNQPGAFLPDLGSEIFVGKNIANGKSEANLTTSDLKAGIKINLKALTRNASHPLDSTFWLRTPYLDNPNNAFSASPGGNVQGNYWPWPLPSVVGALKINLTSSSLIFASSTPAAVYSNQFPDENVMTFRYEDKAGKIQSSAEVKASENKIEIIKAADTGNVFIYVQGKDDSKDECWFYSQAVDRSEDLSVDTIGHNANLSQCNVWLEYKDIEDNMVYAKIIQTPKTLLSETEKVIIKKAKKFPSNFKLFINDVEVGKDGIVNDAITNVKLTVQLDEETRKTQGVEKIEYLTDSIHFPYELTEPNEDGTYTVENFALGIDDVQIGVKLKNYYTLTLNQPNNATLSVKVNGAEVKGDSKCVFGGENIETAVQVDPDKSNELYVDTIYYKTIDGTTEVGTFHVLASEGRYKSNDFIMPKKNVTIGVKMQKETDITGEIDEVESKLDEIEEKLEEKK